MFSVREATPTRVRFAFFMLVDQIESLEMEQIIQPDDGAASAEEEGPRGPFQW